VESGASSSECQSKSHRGKGGADREIGAAGRAVSQWEMVIVVWSVDCEH
jgi:hypothetical protein